MILWLMLFFLVVAISFVLAYQSMNDFRENPEAFDVDYSLYLIRNTKALTTVLLDYLQSKIFDEGYIVSIERLFKGSKSALVIFGPTDILERFRQLDLLELEDYCFVDSSKVYAWEVGAKNQTRFHYSVPQVFNTSDNVWKGLNDNEQFWWQLTFQAHDQQLPPEWRVGRGVMGLAIRSFFKVTGMINGGKTEDSANTSMSSNPKSQMSIYHRSRQRAFRVHIRAAVISGDLERRSNLAQVFGGLGKGQLIRIPRPYTSNQIFSLYQQRAVAIQKLKPFGDTGMKPSLAYPQSSLVLTSEEMLQLIKVYKD